MPHKIYNETVTFGSGHSLIMGHKPASVTMDQIYQKMEEDHHEVGNFGLFDRATPNYTTYYPEVTAEDLQPKDAEFIEPIFRMLSNVSVHANWNPIYFPADVLKSSMYKLIGQTVNIDHEMAVGNAIGTVKSVEWQNAYTTDGIKVPAGINAVLKIDGKANPRIARGIMMDPPSIHSNSVTVNFSWEKSHPKMDDNEFFSKLGSFDEKGKLIQKIATNIEAFHETSLVSHGADPFAQKINTKGKIVNPSYAGNRYKLSDQEIEKTSESLNYVYVDWKQFSDKDIYNPDTGIITITSTTYKNNDDMKELLSFLETLLGLEENSLTEENYEEKLQEFKDQQEEALQEASKPVKVLDLEGLEAIQTEIESLRTKVAGIPENLSDQLSLAETGKTVVEELRQDTTRLYNLSAGEGKSEASILALIAGADYKTLKALHKQYYDLADEEFSSVCGDCGSHNITKASATPPEGGDDKNPKSDGDVIRHFTGVRAVKLPSSLQTRK